MLRHITITQVLILVLIFIDACAEVSPDCSFAKGDVALSSVRRCFASLPTNIANATSTLRTVNAVIKEYSFLSLYNHAGPPYNFQQNVLEDLSAMSQKANASWASDWQFHVRVHKLCNTLYVSQLHMVRMSWVVSLIAFTTLTRSI